MRLILDIRWAACCVGRGASFLRACADGTGQKGTGISMSLVQGLPALSHGPGRRAPTSSCSARSFTAPSLAPF